MKRRIRWVFILVVLIFIIGFVITLKFEQPYPAILYPGFEDIPNVSRSIVRPRIKVFFNNQDSIEIKSTDLFYQSSKVFSNEILRQNFTEKNSFFKPLKNQKKFNFIIGLHHFQIKTTDVYSDKKIKGCVIWIKNRVTEMLGRTDFNRVEVQWDKYAFNKENNRFTNTVVEKFIINTN